MGVGEGVVGLRRGRREVREGEGRELRRGKGEGQGSRATCLWAESWEWRGG